MNYKSIINTVKSGGKISETDFYAEMIEESKISDSNYTQLKIAGEAITKETKNHNINLFSDFFGSDHNDGLVSEFKSKKLHYASTLRASFKTKKNYELQYDYVKLQLEYQRQLGYKRNWLGLMGLMERLLFQFDYFSAPKLIFSTQRQKSGSNYFHYILIRSPFYDLVNGKIDLRIYFKKLEDYPEYKTIDDLIKGNRQFVLDAQMEIRERMREIIDNNPITINEVQTALNELTSENERKNVDDYEKQWLLWKKKHNFETQSHKSNDD